jgi:hypothetical protein
VTGDWLCAINLAPGDRAKPLINRPTESHSASIRAQSSDEIFLQYLVSSSSPRAISITRRKFFRCSSAKSLGHVGGDSRRGTPNLRNDSVLVRIRKGFGHLEYQQRKFMCLLPNIQFSKTLNIQ